MARLTLELYDPQLVARIHRLARLVPGPTAATAILRACAQRALDGIEHDLRATNQRFDSAAHGARRESEDPVIDAGMKQASDSISTSEDHTP